jgi:glycosyltransferase involved in cell wall biosynthesis
MRILLIDNDVFVQKPGGALCVFKTTGEFAVELKELGNEVELLQTRLHMTSDFHDFNVLEKGLRITALKRFQFKVLTYLNAYFQGAWRVFNSDFVYIYYPTNYQYLAFIARLFGKSYGLNVRGQRGVDSRMSKLLYRFSKCILTVSPMFTAIAKSAGANAYTQKPTISFGYKDVVLKRIYAKKEVYKIFFIARLDVAKGIYELIDAVKKLAALGVNFELTIVGDGPELDHVKAKVMQLELREMVHFHNAITDLQKVKKFYSDADIFILPSYHEGFPRTIYEAMIFGTPVITTFVGGIPYLMKDNENCFCIDPKSADSIFDKLLYVMANYSDMERITANARRLVLEILRPDRLTHAQQLNDLLNGTNGSNLIP